MYLCFNGAIPSRKCSINAPAKCKLWVWFSTDICHQRGKWLGPTGIIRRYKYYTAFFSRETCIIIITHTTWATIGYIIFGHQQYYLFPHSPFICNWRVTELLHICNIMNALMKMLYLKCMVYIWKMHVYHACFLTEIINLGFKLKCIKHFN